MMDGVVDTDTDNDTNTEESYQEGQESIGGRFLVVREEAARAKLSPVIGVELDLL